jgi:FKBP-type peptidyl-prolyl cis-trans isomerase
MKTKVFLTASILSLALAACDNGTGGDAGPAGTTTPAGEPVAAVPFETVPLPDAQGEAFVAAMAEREGAERKPSGLVFERLAEGEGSAPDEGDLVKVNFIARVEGRDDPFENTYENGVPVVVSIDDTLPGWREALAMMKPGGRARVTLSSSLAFGPQGLQGSPVGPGQATVYEMELVDVYDSNDEAAIGELESGIRSQIQSFEADSARARQIAQQQRGALAAVTKASSRIFIARKAQEEGVQRTQSGLLYEVVEEGDGEVSPNIGDTIRVHYEGTTPSGETFDSSYDRGQPAEFELGRVIPGWNEGLQLMQAGDRYRFYIPADLAYGARGTGNPLIGPNQALVFNVELLDVTPAEAAEGEAQEQ